MTNSKLITVNRVAARIYEEGGKISIEWFVASDPENIEILYKMDNSKEFQKMSLYVQNAAKSIQEIIDRNFYGKSQENSIYRII